MFIDVKTGVIIHADLDDTVIHGTHRPFDLTHAFFAVIKDTMEYVQLIASSLPPACALDDEDHEWWEGNEGSFFLNDTLFDILDMYAPEGYYFGAHIGNGSDYGYWQRDENESSMFHGSPASQIFS